MADLTGRTIGSYELTRKLGQGGMGAVYVGVHKMLQVPRAIKVLLPTEVDEAVVERFVREGQISAKLSHPNIVKIFDVSNEGDIHYLVMDLVEGRSLLQVLREDGAFTVERAVVVLRQVADALDYAHARGFVHRDIKPSNIIVGADEHVTLIDFGIARAMDESRLTRVGVVVGTFEYMAPEIVTEGGGSPGADRYALAIVAYQMLTGRVPFTGQSAHQIMYKQVHEPPPPPTTFRDDLPKGTEAALLRELSKAPDERFPSAQAFVDALERSTRPQEYESRATTISDITRPGPGFNRPTPGSGQTPVPRSSRSTRPAPAATLTPPGARVLPQPTPPLGTQAGPLSGTQAAPLSGTQYGPRSATAYGEPTSSGGYAQPQATPVPPWQQVAAPRPAAGPKIGLIFGVAAVLIALMAAVTVVTPLRNMVVSTIVGATPTAVPAAQAKSGGVTTPAPQLPTQTPIVITATPLTVPPVVTPAAPVTPAPQAPPAGQAPSAAQAPSVALAPQTPLSPNQRLAQARDAADAKDYPSAIKALDDLESANPQPVGFKDAAYEIHMAYARTLLDQGKADEAYAQFGAALKARPNDSAAQEGQNQIVLVKNYAAMEAAWGKDDELAIRALEDNMRINPDFRETRQKLYSLLIAKADRLLDAGEQDAAFTVLMRALDVLPDAGEAQKRLTRYTPTPIPAPPTATPVPYVPPPRNTGGGGTSTGGGGTSTGGGGTSTGGGGSQQCPGGFCP